jgi:alpha-ketoglutarate-dependent taurine dioxygenase
MALRLSKIEPFGLMIEPEMAGAELRDLEIEHLRGLFRKEQLLLLRGFGPLKSAEDFARYCASWGEISKWPFGEVLVLKEQKNPEDHIFDNNYVPMHWDGMYRCVEAPLAGQGGRTTFSHTGRVLEKAVPKTRELWEKVIGRYERKMEFYDSITESRVVTTHPFRDFPVIRYNEPPKSELAKFLNPPVLKFSGASELKLQEFHQSLQAAIYAPHAFYAHEWQAGDLVVADNFTLLHGREGFQTKAPRHLERVHVLSDPPLNNPGLISHA